MLRLVFVSAMSTKVLIVFYRVMVLYVATEGRREIFRGGNKTSRAKYTKQCTFFIMSRKVIKVRTEPQL